MSQIKRDKVSMSLKKPQLRPLLPNDDRILQNSLTFRNQPLKKIIAPQKTERQSKFKQVGLFFFPKTDKEFQSTTIDNEFNQSFSLRLSKQFQERQEQIHKFKNDLVNENKFLLNQLEKLQSIDFKKSKKTKSKYRIQKNQQNVESLQLMLQCRIQKNIFNDVQIKIKNNDQMKNCLIQNCVIDQTNILKEDNRLLQDHYGIDSKNTRNNNLILEEIILSRLSKNQIKKEQQKQLINFQQ